MTELHVARPDGSRFTATDQEVRELLSRGELSPDVLFWRPGMPEWRPLRELGVVSQPPPLAPHGGAAPPAHALQRETSPLAITSLVLGLLGFLFWLLTAIPAVITGHIALRKISRSRGTIGGSGMAIAGLVLGYFGIIFGLGVFAAILIPTVDRVRESARRTVDASNLRQIGQAALIYAYDRDGELPPATIETDEGDRPATIHDVAFFLATGGGLNDAAMWLSADDRSRSGRERSLTTVTDRGSTGPVTLNPTFAALDTIDFDFVTGLSTDLPSTTPIAWTRGLREDGSWDPAGVYQGEGGHIVFLGGHVSFYRNLGGGPEARLVRPDGTRTANILETLPAGARVVGAGPATLNGKTGRAKP